MSVKVRMRWRWKRRKRDIIAKFLNFIYQKKKKKTWLVIQQNGWQIASDQISKNHAPVRCFMLCNTGSIFHGQTSQRRPQWVEERNKTDGWPRTKIWRSQGEVWSRGWRTETAAFSFIAGAQLFWRKQACFDGALPSLSEVSADGHWGGVDLLRLTGWLPPPTPR